MACYPWPWLNQLQQPTLKAFCFMNNAKISVEVRDQFTNWIKSQIFNTPAYTNDQQANYELNAAKFLNQLLRKLNRMAANYSGDVSHELNKSVCMIVELFANNPVQLYQQLLECMEGQCIAYPYKCIYLADMEEAEVLETLHRLRIMVHKHENDNADMKKEHEYLAHEMKELQEFRSQLNMILNEEIQMNRGYQIAQRQDKLNDNLHTLWRKRSALINEFRHTILMTAQLQDKVLNKYLSQWKINQRLTGSAASAMAESNLYTIQLWCESLLEIISNTKVQLTHVINTQLEGCMNLMEAPDLMTAMKDVTSLYETLIFNSFIVEKQPPQILKMNTRFDTTVRLLLGNALNIDTNQPQVTVSIISEYQAQEIQSTKKATNCTAGEFINYKGRMEYKEGTRLWSARFNDIRLTKINRKKQPKQYVMDEKFALLFQFIVTAEQCGLVLPVWTISCPVVVIVHGCQMQRGYANIIWDNAFAKINRTPFSVPDTVCWNWLADVLSLQLNGNSDHSLTADQKYFLCEKALGCNQPFPIPNDLTIRWSQFCQEMLPGRNHTFWEWFYMVMKLTREHLQKLWFDGRIIGFIQKKQADKYLTNCHPGTFLLRFSDSVLGGITIAFVHEANDGHHEILHIQPFTAYDLSIRSLTDRILDYDELSHLYPYIPKHVAFQRLKKKSVRPQDTNYVATELRANLMFPSDSTPDSQLCNNQLSAASEYTCSGIDQLSFFELQDFALFSQDFE
ncbi:signal transducer and transcription activator-like [Anopheles funestus]|uniref:signal transducer and transcription activator-like n=1 Tax=Anopheles funestus TaxID=62324 RepID=UPI0020C695D8|nr:signal transducer and transcription activator-like [Anopheles funestus]XP_049299914.1 signal transducer and transcription activator-like [Anopheles funestus]